MDNILKADAFYYKKYSSYIIAGILIPLILFHFIVLSVDTTELTQVSQEGKLTILFSMNLFNFLFIAFFLLCILGQMKYSKLLRLQIISLGDRKTVYLAKFLEIIVLGAGMQFIITMIEFLEGIYLMDLRITPEMFLISAYQLSGLIRFLLWSYVFFILFNKIKIGLVCSLLKICIEGFALAYIVMAMQQMKLGNVLAQFLIYLPIMSTVYSSAIMEMVQPVMLVTISGIEMIFLWAVGAFIFARKAL